MAPVHNGVRSLVEETKDLHMKMKSLVLGNMVFSLMGSLVYTTTVNLVLDQVDLPSIGPQCPP